MPRYIFIPCVEKGQGSGHLRRCILFAAQCGESGFLAFFDLNPRLEWTFEEIAGRYDLSALEGRILFSRDELYSDDVLVFDKKEMSLEEYREYASFRNKIAIDEGGDARRYIPYLADMLPLPDSYGAGNIYSPSFLELPEKIEKKRNLPGKVLVTFGGEDPMKLTEPMVAFLHQQGDIPYEDMTVVKGPLFGDITLPPGVRLWESPENLKAKLCEFDLVCTSFGITAFECVSAGIPVVLLNPAEYHQSLSEKAGFCSLGVVNPSKGLFDTYLSKPEEINKAVEESLNREYDDFPGYLETLLFSGSFCPVCGTSDNPVLERYRYKTYFSCTRCGMEYMTSFKKNGTDYKEDYFFTDYKKQYGRTYLEDFETIKGFGNRRIKNITRCLSRDPKGAAILDMGCAFGPFLGAAGDAGYSPYGIDVYDKAVEYVNHTLNIPARECSVYDVIPALFDLPVFDIVTMWFVIEHFQDLHGLLVKINSLLPIGGIFAFSTPNGKGISRKKNRSRFFSISPDDHYSVWNPAAAEKILKKYGFVVKKIEVTGHHGERFFKKNVPVFLKKWASLYSRVRGLGDTFEIYAEKIGEPAIE